MESLIKPNARYKDSYISAIKEYHKEGFQTDKIDLSYVKNNFEEYLSRIDDWSKGKGLPSGFVSQTELWLVDPKEYIGTIKIRHDLNDYLGSVGGHIGYFIRPSRRARGFGNKILEMGLKEAIKIGLKDALITCDVSNLSSQRVILNNCGKYESTVHNPPGEPRDRYWIHL